MNWRNLEWWLGRARQLRGIPPVLNYLYNPGKAIEGSSISPNCAAEANDVVTIYGLRFGAQGYVTLLWPKTGEEWVSPGGPTNNGQKLLKLYNEATEPPPGKTVPLPGDWSYNWLAFVTPNFDGDAEVTVTAQNGLNSNPAKITVTPGA